MQSNRWGSEDAAGSTGGNNGMPKGKGKTGKGGGGAKASGGGYGGYGKGPGGKANANGGGYGKGPGGGGPHGKADAKGNHGSKGSGGGGSRWDSILAAGTQVKCQNTLCVKLGELATGAGWECKGCGEPYDWQKFWASLRMVDEDSSDEDTGQGYRGKYECIAPDEPLFSDEEEETVATPAKISEAEAASKADSAAAEARKAWDKAKANEATERKQLADFDVRLQNLLRQVQEQKDKIAVKKGKLRDATTEAASIQAKLGLRNEEQEKSAKAHILSVEANMEAADKLAAEQNGKQAASARKTEEEARKKAERDAKVLKAKQDQKALEKRAEAKAAADRAEVLAAEVVQEEAAAVRATEAYKKAEANLGDSTSGEDAGSGPGTHSAPSGVVSAPKTPVGALDPPQAVSMDTADEPESDKDACSNTPPPLVAITAEDVDQWKKALVHWIWFAGADEEPNKDVLGWTDIWGGDEGAKVMLDFATGAKQARDLLATKRLECRKVWEEAQKLAGEGQTEAAQQLAWQAEQYSEELRGKCGDWLYETITEQIEHLLAKREADLLNGTNAKRPEAIQYDMAPRRDAKGKGKGKNTGKAAASGGKGPTADIAEGKKVIKKQLEKTKGSLYLEGAQEDEGALGGT